MTNISKEQLSLIAKLHQKKYRDELGFFFVEGEKGVSEAIKSKMPIELIVTSQEHEYKGYNTVHITESQTKKVKSVKTWPGVLAVIKKPENSFETVKEAGKIVALDRINDPGNLGTIIRSCHFFGIIGIVLSEDSVDPYNEKVVRASMGSLFHVSVYSSENILSDLKTLKEEGFFVSAFDVDGGKGQVSKKEKQVYLFGSESHGISPNVREYADEIVTIQKQGGAESLNVSVSVGIGLFMR